MGEKLLKQTRDDRPAFQKHSVSYCRLPIILSELKRQGGVAPSQGDSKEDISSGGEMR